jgi:hypothetical protein
MNFMYLTQKNELCNVVSWIKWCFAYVNIIINKYCKLFNVYFSLCFFFEKEDKYVFKAREFVLLLVQVDNSQWILYDWKIGVKRAY